MSLVKKIISLLIFTVLAFGASAWGGLVTSLYKEPWYSTIIKPTFNPPDWVFAPVWITLYLAMSVAIWLIWINQKNLTRLFTFILFICLLMEAGVCFSLDFTSYLYL